MNNFEEDLENIDEEVENDSGEEVDDESEEEFGDDSGDDSGDSRKEFGRSDYNGPSVTVVGPKNPFTGLIVKNIETISLKTYYKKEDLFGNSTLVHLIEETIKNKGGLVVRSPSGFGKTTFIETIVRSLGYDLDIQNEDFSEVSFDKLKKALLSDITGIQKMFQLKKSIMLFKHYDTMKIEHQKSLFKLIQTKQIKTAILFTTNNIQKSFRIPRGIDLYFYEVPSVNNLLSLVSNTINCSPDIIFLANKCHGDIRHFLMNVENRRLGLLDKNDNEDKETEGKKNYCTNVKDFNQDIKKTLKYVLECDIYDGIRFSTLHSNAVIYENYPIFMKKSDDLITMAHISDLTSFGDISYNFLSKNQMWDTSIADQYIFYGSVYPLKLIKKCIKYTDTDRVISVVKYSPNYKINTDISWEILEEISYILRYIIKSSGQGLEEYFEKLHEKYCLKESHLKIICKMYKELNIKDFKKYLKKEDYDKNIE